MPSQNNGGSKNLVKWKPGQSGNPGGRPKGLAKAVREIAPADELADWYRAIWRCDPDALEARGIALKDVTLAERNKAAEWLSDHGYGKAPVHAPVEGGDPLEHLDDRIGALVDDLAAARESKADRPATGGTMESATG